MNFEDKLLAKCVQTGGVEKLISAGIVEDHFADPKNVDVWNFLVRHTQKYKSSPEPQAVKQEFPEYEFDVVTDPLEYVKDQFVIDLKRREAHKSIQHLIAILDENDREQLAIIDETFLDRAKDLAQIIPSSNVSRMSEMDQRIEDYKIRKKEGIRMGIPYGIDRLDEMTLGLHPHQYVTIAGFTGVGKSTLGMYFALQHYLAGYTPMIISLEMDEDEIYTKLDGMAAQLKQQAIRAMDLSGADVARWEKKAEQCDSMKPQDIIVIDVDFATPARVYAETARWSPDAVIVDYVQLMIAPKQYRTIWEQVGYCSKMLKSQAKAMRIPVYGLAQTNAEGEEGAELSNLGGAKSISHHSDLVLGLKQDDVMKGSKNMEIRVLKNRTGPLGKFMMYWDQAESRIEPYDGLTHGWTANPE